MSITNHATASILLCFHRSKIDLPSPMRSQGSHATFHKRKQFTDQLDLFQRLSHEIVMITVEIIPA